MASRIEKLCIEKGIKLTENRKILARVISESDDHPNAEEILKRARIIKPKIGIATIYRIIKVFEEGGLIEKHDFREGKARYEEYNEDAHHDHLVNIKTGEVIEFFDENLEKLKKKIAYDLGYDLIDHRLDLYVSPITKKDE